MTIAGAIERNFRAIKENMMQFFTQRLNTANQPSQKDGRSSNFVDDDVDVLLARMELVGVVFYKTERASQNRLVQLGESLKNTVVNLAIALRGIERCRDIFAAVEKLQKGGHREVEGTIVFPRSRREVDRRHGLANA